MRAINLRTEHMINPIGIHICHGIVQMAGDRPHMRSWLWMKIVWFGTVAG